MKNQKAFTFGAALILLPHLFCCALPLALAAISVIAPATGSRHIEIVPHEYMPFLFLFSGLMLAVGYYFTFFKCDCSGAGHRRQKILLYAVTLLFLIGLAMYFLSHSDCSH